MKNPLVLLVLLVFVSCKTNHFMSITIPKTVDDKTVGLIVRVDGSRDTSIISHSIQEQLSDCGFSAMENLFKPEIYLKENFDLLYQVDSAFLYAQPSLKNLSQLLVAKAEYKMKQDGTKKTFGIEFNAKWISLSPIRVRREFYFVEIINGASGTESDKEEINGYLAGQIHVKLCYEIRKYIK